MTTLTLIIKKRELNPKTYKEILRAFKESVMLYGYNLKVDRSPQSSEEPLQALQVRLSKLDGSQIPEVGGIKTHFPDLSLITNPNNAIAFIQAIGQFESDNKLDRK